MILNNETVDTIVIGADKTKAFGISNNSVIFDVLRNRMYTDPISAICREIASNSRDANREAGRGDQPIEIKVVEGNAASIFMGLSSDLAIAFCDNGIGISPQRMNDVFLMYGESTKRATNTQTGGFGLGAKTPFAYSDTFSIKTVNEEGGIRKKYIYVANLDKERKGEMHLFRTEETTDPTGTEVFVPIKREDRQRFETSAHKYTALWDVRPKYTNFSGNTVRDYKRFEFFDDDGTKLFDIWQGRYDHGHITVLLDGIPFPANLASFNNTAGVLNFNGVISIPFDNGVLDPAANREYLQENKENNALIMERLKKVGLKAQQWMEKFFKDIPTYAHALVAAHVLENGTLANVDSEKEFLSYMMNQLMYWGLQYHQKGEVTLKWNGKPVHGSLKMQKFIAVRAMSKNGFYNPGRRNIFPRTDLSLFATAYLAMRPKDGTKPIIYNIDSEEKMRLRMNTIFLADKTFNAVFMKTLSLDEHIIIRKSDYHIHVKDNEVDEKYIKQKIKDDADFKRKYEELEKKQADELASELEIINELFEVVNISTIPPTSFTPNAGVPRELGPVYVQFLEYGMFASQDSMNDTSRVKANMRTTNWQCDMNIDRSVHRKKDAVATLEKTIIFQAKKIGHANVDANIVLFTQFIAWCLSQGEKVQYKVIASARNYNSMVSAGAIPWKTFFENLTPEDLKKVTDCIQWWLIRKELLILACNKKITAFDANDKKTIDAFNVNKVWKKKSGAGKASAITELTPAMLCISQKNTAYELEYLGMQTYIKELRDEEKYITKIAGAEVWKAIQAANADDINAIIEKYPMLNILKIEMDNDAHVKILNDYITLIQKQ